MSLMANAALDTSSTLYSTLMPPCDTYAPLVGRLCGAPNDVSSTVSATAANSDVGKNGALLFTATLAPAGRNAVVVRVKQHNKSNPTNIARTIALDMMATAPHTASQQQQRHKKQKPQATRSNNKQQGDTSTGYRVRRFLGLASPRLSAVQLGINCVGRKNENEQNERASFCSLQRDPVP